MKKNIRRIKFFYLARFWWKITFKDTIAPLTDTSARLQFLMLLTLIFFILPPKGYDIWISQVVSSWRLLTALILVLPIFLILNGLFAIFKVRKELNELGQWVQNKFVYHAPVHLLTTVVTDADNGKLIPFYVKGLHKNAGIEVIIKKQEFDEHNVRAQFVVHKDMPIIWDEYERSTLLGWSRPEGLYITTHKATPSNASTVKVYLLSWSP